MDELPGGIRRLTFPLPLGIDHVHCYLLPGSDGWTLVDTGLGLPDAAARWEAALDGVEVARIVITHFHPDHVGGGEDAQALHRRAGSPGRLTTTSSACASGAATTGRSAWPTTCSGTACPTRSADELRHESRTFAPFIRFARDPELLREGDEVDGWRVLELPGHADGHICLERDGVLVAGDHLLGAITPTVGLYPESRPDPLGRLPGEPAADDRARAANRAARPRRARSPTRSRARARSSSTTSAGSTRRPRRSARSRAAPTRSPSRSSALTLDASGRRFALAETLAHLERLVQRGPGRAHG